MKNDEKRIFTNDIQSNVMYFTTQMNLNSSHNHYKYIIMYDT